jgi:ribulose-5-phosphate 4-epimerase/fuculose-1-phosphate aldolase
MSRIIPGDVTETIKFDNIQDERHERKLKLASAFRLFSHYGFDEGIAGHITARDPEFTDTFWVNPFGLYFGNICVSDLIRVDMDGEILEGKQKQLNKAAFIIHSRIHHRRPDVNAIAHAHSMYGRIFSATGRMLRPFTIEATPFYDDHVLFSQKGGVINQLTEGEAVAKALGDKKAMILRNHGLLTVGKTVDEAAWWFIAMERSCQAQILLTSFGNETVELDEEEAKRGYEELGDATAGWYQFQPLFQKMMKEQPDLSR